MKAVIYARYSSDNQREESIEGQLRECKEYAEKNGITILRSYIDRALSAKTDNRPEFQNMIKDSGKRLMGVRGGRKEIMKQLNKMKFQEICAKGKDYEELLYRECCHMVKTYMELSESDKAYNSTLFGIMKMSSERAKDKLKADIYDTAVVLPQTLKMEEELGIVTRAAREMYELHFPGEGSLGADR